jgi:predicted aspartyl protease
MIAGFFDRAHRAIVRVVVTGGKQSATLHLEVDTGSQPHICMDEDWADHLGIVTTKGHRATLADGKSKSVLAAAAAVSWHGSLHPVEVIVWPRSKKATPLDKSLTQYRGTPEGLIGRQLLMGSALSLDYLNRQVLITQPPPSGA